MNNITILAGLEFIGLCVAVGFCIRLKLKLDEANKAYKDAIIIAGGYFNSIEVLTMDKQAWMAEVRKQTDLFQEEQSKVKDRDATIQQVRTAWEVEATKLDSIIKDRDATIALLREEREKLSNASMSTIYDLQKELADTELARLHLENICNGQASTINKMLPIKKENEALIDIVVELLQCLPEIETKPDDSQKYDIADVMGKKFSIRCRNKKEFSRIVNLAKYDFTDSEGFGQFANTPHVNCHDRSIETWEHKGFTIIDSIQIK